MGRCASTTVIPNVRGAKDPDGKVIMVTVRCQDGSSDHLGPHWNGHQGDGREHTLEWGE